MTPGPCAWRPPTGETCSADPHEVAHERSDATHFLSRKKEEGDVRWQAHRSRAKGLKSALLVSGRLLCKVPKPIESSHQLLEWPEGVALFGEDAAVSPVSCSRLLSGLTRSY